MRIKKIGKVLGELVKRSANEEELDSSVESFKRKDLAIAKTIQKSKLEGSKTLQLGRKRGFLDTWSLNDNRSILKMLDNCRLIGENNIGVNNNNRRRHGWKGRNKG
jgi:hypothetical protein